MAAEAPQLSLSRTNGQWRLDYRLPATDAAFQILSAPSLEALIAARPVLLELAPRQTHGSLALGDLRDAPARFFQLRQQPDPTNRSAALFELPAPAPYLVSQPLIFDGRLYAHSTAMPGQLGRQYLSCYDLRRNRQCLWSTVLGEDLFTMDLMDKISWNLIRSEDVIPLVVYSVGTKQRFLLVDAISGEIRANRAVGTQWPYYDPRGRLRQGSVIAPTGNLAEHGEELLFANGTMLCKCSGEVAWSNQGWILFGSDAIVIRDTALGFASGASLRIKAVDLSLARQALTGFIETEQAILFQTDAGSSLANTYTTDHFLVSESRIYKGRIYTAAMGGPEPGQYLEEFSATNGAFLRRARVTPPPGAMDVLQWGQPAVSGYLQQSGHRLLMPFAGLIVGVGDSKACRVHAFDTASLTQAWSFTYAGQHTHAIPTRDHLWLVEELYERNSSRYQGFRLLQVDLATGLLKATLSDAGFTNRTDYRPSGLALDASSAICVEKQPLLYEGCLYLPVHSQKGSAFWIVDVGDTSANVLQYKFNNQLNPVLNLGQPASNQGIEVLPVKEGAAEDSRLNQTADFAVVSTHNPAIDTPAQAHPVGAILSSLGLTTNRLEELPRGYVALLERVEFSNHGEDSLDNVGEGYLKLRTRFGCDQTALRYPWRGFLGLHYEPPSIHNGNVAGPDFRRFSPHLPLFYRPDFELTGANASLYLSYSALEDDDYDTFGKIQLFAREIASIALGILAGDYCHVAELAAAAAAREVDNYTDSFGAPFATLFNGATDATPNLYGIPIGQDRNELHIASSASRDPLVAAAEALHSACAISDLASGDVSSLNNVVSSTLDLFSEDEHSTRGVVTLRAARLLRVKSLSVTLDRVDVPGTPLSATFHARVGLLGEDALSSAPEGVVSSFETPFQSYAKREALSLQPNRPITNLLYSANLSLSSSSHGSAGVYTELDLDILGTALQRGSAVHSETRFFEDILFGAWEQDATNPKRFRKTVVQPLNSRTLQGTMTLTYQVLLDP